MTTRASKQVKTGPEITDLDGDGRRFALSVDGLIRFTGSREDCENRLRLLIPAPGRDYQNHRLGRILAALALAVLVGIGVPRGTEAASSINTAQPVQGAPYNAAPIRSNFGAASNDILSLQRMNAGATAPSSPTLGMLWLETPTGETSYLLKIWNDRLSAWVQIATLDSLNGLWVTNVGGGLPETLLADDTTDLGLVPNAVITVTGAGPVYSLGSTAPPGVVKIVIFSGATQLIYNATSLILPGAANLTTAAGDIAIFTSLTAGNWQGLYFQGAASLVPQGGTGRTSLTNHAVLLGAGTSPVNFAVPGTSGYPLLSAGASADPAFGQLDLAGAGVTGTVTVAHGGTGRTTITAHALMLGNGTGAPTLLTPGAASLPLISLGGTLDPVYQLLPVSGGGTGTNFLTQYNVLLGMGAGGMAFAAPGTAGYPLLSTGAAANPAFGQLNLAGAGVTGVLPLAKLPFTIPTSDLLGGNGTGFAGISINSTLALGASVLGVDPTLALTTLTTSGNITVGGKIFLASSDAQFYAEISGDTPVIAFDANRYVGYDRGSDELQMIAGASASIVIHASGTTNLVGHLIMSGDLTANTLTTVGNATIGGTLVVTSAANVGSTLGVVGLLTAGAGITVNGGTTAINSSTVSLSAIPISGGGKEILCYDTGSKEISFSNAGVC